MNKYMLYIIACFLGWGVSAQASAGNDDDGEFEVIGTRPQGIPGLSATTMLIEDARNRLKKGDVSLAEFQDTAVQLAAKKQAKLEAFDDQEAQVTELNRKRAQIQEAIREFEVALKATTADEEHYRAALEKFQKDLGALRSNEQASIQNGNLAAQDAVFDEEDGLSLEKLTAEKNGIYAQIKGLTSALDTKIKRLDARLISMGATVQEVTESHEETISQINSINTLLLQIAERAPGAVAEAVKEDAYEWQAQQNASSDSSKKSATCLLL